MSNQCHAHISNLGEVESALANLVAKLADPATQATLAEVLAAAGQWRDTLGALHGYAAGTDGVPQIVGRTYRDEVARGHVLIAPGVPAYVATIAGRLDDTVANSKDTIWSFAHASIAIGGNTYTGGNNPAYPPAGGTTLYLRSSSANDTLAGTGAQKCQVHYLDKDYIPRSVTLEMNGTTAVQIAADVLRVQKIYVTQVGSGGTAAGNILAVSVPAGNGSIYHGVPVGRQSSFGAFWTVPAGQQSLVTRWSCSANNLGNQANKYALVVLASKATTEGGPTNNFVMRDGISLYNVAPVIGLDPPMAVPEKTDIRMTVECTADHGFVTGGFHGWCEAM